jgi:hypothetical protein
MKAPSFAALALFLSASSLEAAEESQSRSPFQASERTLHSQKWESVTSQVDETGREVLVTNAYTEIRTFLNRFDQNAGEYVPASEGIEIVDGFGVSRNTAYQLNVSGNQNAAEGAVDILMPDGKRMVLQCVGLAYYEPETGNAVWIAEAKDSIGIVEGNTVTWRDAFDDVRASIRVEARLDAVEHDVLIEEQLPDPALFGLTGKVRLQVWHQVLKLPAASIRQEQVMRSDGIQEPDSAVDFGTMMLDRGMAFPVDAERWGMGGGNPPKDKGAVHVSKEWVNIQGFDWLIETLPLEEALPQMQELPEPAVAVKVDRQVLKEKMLASRKAGRSKPVSVAKAESKAEKQRTVASLQTGAYKPTRGYLVDYITRSSGVTNHRWQGDTVYYISGPVTCSGTNTVFEAGTVLKYAANASVTINSALTWEATPYRPIIMTAKDDNSVGETISGSTGNPNSSFYANPALYISSGSAALHNFRIAHAQKGIFYYDTSGNSGSGITHAQFVHCDKAIQANGYGSSFKNIFARNVLMTDCLTAFYGYSFNASVEHLTLSKSTRLSEDYNGQTYGTTSTLSVTNSVLVNVTNLHGSRSVTIGGNRNGFFNTANQFGANLLLSASNPLQTVHAGAGYLANDTEFRHAATTAITPSLKATLAKMTTYPPTLLTSNFTTTTALAPVAPRGGSSLGYHYDPIDYLWTSLAVTNNSTLRLTNGVAIASYGPRLVRLFGSSSVISEGKPASLNRLTTYNAVQEQPGVWITNTWHMVIDGSNFRLRFTDVSLLAGGTGARHLHSGEASDNLISIRDSLLRGINWPFSHYGGNFTSPSIVLTNNILQRCTLSWNQGDEASVPLEPYYFSMTWRNNLFSMCSLSLNFYSPDYGAWEIYDNLFDTSLLNITHAIGTLTGADYNGFIATSNPLGGTHNKTSLLRDFVSGPLGQYYYPTNTTTNSLFILVNSGSRTNAAQVGLYHYVTTTNQTKEANSRLDIGHHYVAVNAEGLPLDTDGDGAPDYSEDKNGSGDSESGETAWNNSDSDNDGVPDGYEIQLGTNPLVDEPNQSGQRINYVYDKPGRLRTLSGKNAESIVVDFEGNVTQAQ